MFRRHLSPAKTRSFFLFGARGTGKSTYLAEHYQDKHTLLIDLLKGADEARLRKDPDRLSSLVDSKKYRRVIIDEVQKLPKLLDIVQSEMLKKKKLQFILTGSSARKLRRGTGNLLAGRAFTYHLFPLTFWELEKAFNLAEVLNFGSLPEVFGIESDKDRNEFLRSYVQTYLKEEVLAEQLTRRIEPFRDFLSIAAQHNGKILNYSSIAKDIGVDDKTVLGFFQILEDTLLGAFLPAFHRSVRKRQRVAPKFYLFDLGVKRAMEETLSAPVIRSTYAYGVAFEHLVMVELFRLREYARAELRLSYLRTKDDAEIDLVIEIPRYRTILIEIKSNTVVKKSELSTLVRFKKDWPTPAEAQVWSNDPDEQIVEGCQCLHWQEALRRLFKLR